MTDCEIYIFQIIKYFKTSTYIFFFDKISKNND